MSDYDTDLLLWSERQAALLRRAAAGEQVNDQVDWRTSRKKSSPWANATGAS
jgi:hypothetical protein